MSFRTSLRDAILSMEPKKCKLLVLPVIPKELWKEVFDLTNTYYVAEIAAALGISSQYLKRRLEKQPKVILGFTQAQVLNNKNQSLIELTIKRQEHPITLRWTGLIKELPLLIEKLFRGEFS